jgi:hypothetical protein
MVETKVYASCIWAWGMEALFVSNIFSNRGDIATNKAYLTDPGSRSMSKLHAYIKYALSRI